MGWDVVSISATHLQDDPVFSGSALPSKKNASEGFWRRFAIVFGPKFGKRRHRRGWAPL